MIGRRRLASAGRWAIIGLLVLWVFAPLYPLVLIAFQDRAEILTTPPTWLPSLDLSNFEAVFSATFGGGTTASAADYILPGIVNSAIVAVAVALANVIVGAPAAYAFARFRMPGGKTLPVALLASTMVPVFAFLVPYYVVLRNLGLTNTRMGIIVADLSVTLPLTVWILRGYFRNLPVDVERAARVDGCNRLGAFLRVALPLALPGLLSIGLFAFMQSWNGFIFPLVLNSSVDAMMIQPAIAGLSNPENQSFGIMAAGTIVAAAPTVVLALVAQRYLVRGLVAGVGKG